jgi:hypothetical protein
MHKQSACRCPCHRRPCRLPPQSPPSPARHHALTPPSSPARHHAPLHRPGRLAMPATAPSLHHHCPPTHHRCHPPTHHWRRPSRPSPQLPASPSPVSGRGHLSATQPTPAATVRHRDAIRTEHHRSQRKHLRWPRPLQCRVVVSPLPLLRFMFV